jgi:GntR family transcriptional regulator/MocR family aminotransferase
MIVEDPMTIPIYENFIRLGLHVEPIEVDDQGMRTDLLPNNKRPRGIFVTPSHQFPLGGILPVQRRIELIRFTQESGSYIIEDDYDSEFRHQGSPLPALQELAPDRVVYVGTFSKMLFPGLRLGYVVLPPTLIEEFVGRKRIHDLGCPTVDQLTLARFIDEGHLQRHILQMKKLYAKRRLTLIRSLAKAFGDKVRILGDATGMHLIADFLKLRFSPKEVERFRSGGVRVYPVEEYAIVHGRHANRLVFGYGNLSPEQIERGVSRLAQLLNKI